MPEKAIVLKAVIPYARRHAEDICRNNASLEKQYKVMRLCRVLQRLPFSPAMHPSLKLLAKLEVDRASIINNYSIAS